jgi:(p)ppGpp synthase/HD superfamily hydrolase
MTLLQKAEQLARNVHASQKRTDGRPYITHVGRVVAALAHESEHVQMVAWLHDVLEDSAMTMHDLEQAGFSTAVDYAVELLTRSPEQDYWSYLSAIKRFDMARVVKVADMLDNLTDNPTPGSREKYKKGILYLCK